MGQWWPAEGSEAVSAAVHAWDLLKEVTIILTTSTIVWTQKANAGNRLDEQQVKVSPS